MLSTPNKPAYWSCAPDCAPVWPWVLGLCVLAASVQLLVAAQAVVPAQDAARYVACAQAIERDGFWPTVIERDDAPTFPALVWLVHSIARTSGESPDLWALCVQGAAGAALVLAVAPLFLLLRRAFGPWPAGMGAALVITAPEAARLGANGLADGLFLALVCWGLWLAFAFGRHAVTAVAGGCVLGLAFLTRLEAIVLLPPLAWALARYPTLDDAPTSWRTPCTLLAGFALVLAGFTGATGKLTPKHGPEFLANLVTPAAGVSVDIPRRIKPAVIPHKDASVTSREYGYLSAAAALADEGPQAIGWLAGVCLLIGLWQSPRSRSPAWNVLVASFTPCFLLATWHFAAVAGYLSARHLLLLTVLCGGWAGAGLLALCGWISAWLARLARSTPSQPAAAPQIRPVPGLIALAIALTLSLSAAVRPLHASRQAHREAGDWLAATASPGEAVLDTRLWTSLYSGLPTYGIDRAPAAAADPRLRYVVVEADELERDSPRGRALRRFVADCQPAAEFPRLPARERSRKVYVFRRASHNSAAP